MIRRVIAVITLAILWALEWVLLGAFFGVYQFYFWENYAILDPPFWAGPFWTVVLVTAISFAKVGALSGALFALVLALAERRQSVDKLRLTRVILWGIIGAWLIPGTLLLINLNRYGIPLWWFMMEYLLVVGIAGGISAGTTLLLARRAPPHAAA